PVRKRVRQNPVCPELVEGPSFSSSGALGTKKKQPFDKLRTGGIAMYVSLPFQGDGTSAQPRQQAAGLFEVRLVDHPPVELERARAGAGAECVHYRPRLSNLRFAGSEG